MVLEKAKIYGVDGVGKSTPTLTRTDAAVGLTTSVGVSEITSDFDNCYPWCEMREEVDSEGNVFIRIPKFYTKITKNSDGSYKHQISGVRYSGFTTLFVDGKGNEIDYVLVGKYEASGSSTKAYSKSGQTVLVNITLPSLRTACKANGAGYQQYDFLIDAIIKELFMIEFATTNSQSIMYGYANGNSAALATGHTDSVKTPSGSANNGHEEDCTACNTDGKHACKYRGIENLWGNVYKWCDGITFSAEKVYICLDPEKYASENTGQPYNYVGDRPTSGGWLKEIEYFDKFPLLGYIKTASGGSSSTYYCDYTHYSSSGTVLLVGGGWDDGAGAGLWFWGGRDSASDAYSGVGGRLCFKPLPERD